MEEAEHSHAIVLDGNSLTIEQLVRIARNPGVVTVEVSEEARKLVEKGEDLVEDIVEKYRETFFKWKADGSKPVMDYGVTTGFGEFKDIPIHPDDLKLLQRNILLSHAVGVGENADREDPANYFPAEVVRAALVVRLNAFLHGYSGVRVTLLKAIEAMINQGIIPLVPLRGSVGSSGDLCPLAHLFVVFLREGRYYVVDSPEDLAYQARRLKKAKKHLKADLSCEDKTWEWEELIPTYKEGLALTNGATFSAAMLALAVYDAQRTANAADVAAAMTLEATCGCARALDEKVHGARRHRGQIDSAANIRALIEESHFVESLGEVQDPYSLRCAPQVHGASRDAIAYARMVAEDEIKAATDNPLFFPGSYHDNDPHSPLDWRRYSQNWPAGYQGKERYSYSAGNFHGQPIALAADFLAIALAELADISERRTQLLLDQHQNRGLPANLIPNGGVNSGFMIAQYCAASLVSENKVLTHPASVDSIPTSANSEDHNSMATFAARKLRTVLGNCQATLAIELMVAAQGLEWRFLNAVYDEMEQVASGKNSRALEKEAEKQAKESEDTPERHDDQEWYVGRVAQQELAQNPTAPTVLEWQLHQAVRKEIGEPDLDGKSFDDNFKLRLDEFARAERKRLKKTQTDLLDRAFKARFDPESELDFRHKLPQALGKGTCLAYQRVRSVVPSMIEDRPLDEDIRAIRRLLADNSLIEELKKELPDALKSIPPLMSP